MRKSIKMRISIKATMKTVVILLFLALVIFAGTPGSFARPQYVDNLTAVYGSGSCHTCHIMGSGGGTGPGGGRHAYNGTGGGHHAYNGTFGQQNVSGQHHSNGTFPLNSYGTLFQNQSDHATDPSAALMAIGAPQTASAATQDPGSTTAPHTPGFGIVVSMAGLFVCALLAKRHDK
jgi:hypothetical protein